MPWSLCSLVGPYDAVTESHVVSDTCVLAVKLFLCAQWAVHRVSDASGLVGLPRCTGPGEAAAKADTTLTSAVSETGERNPGRDRGCRGPSQGGVLWVDPSCKVLQGDYRKPRSKVRKHQRSGPAVQNKPSLVLEAVAQDFASCCCPTLDWTILFQGLQTQGPPVFLQTLIQS